MSFLYVLQTKWGKSSTCEQNDIQDDVIVMWNDLKCQLTISDVLATGHYTANVESVLRDPEIKTQKKRIQLTANWFHGVAEIVRAGCMLAPASSDRSPCEWRGWLLQREWRSWRWSAAPSSTWAAPAPCSESSRCTPSVGCALSHHLTDHTSITLSHINSAATATVTDVTHGHLTFQWASPDFLPVAQGLKRWTLHWQTFPIYAWRTADMWPLRGYGVRYGSTNQANSAFHPFRVNKWVVIHVITWQHVHPVCDATALQQLLFLLSVALCKCSALTFNL